MSEVIIYPLGEIAKIKGGKRLPKGSLLVPEKNQHPYIRVTDMGSRFIPIEKLMYVPDDVFPLIKNYITNTNDVLVSIVGTIGAVALVDEKLNNASLTENCVKIKPLENNLNPYYLYYFLISTKGQEEIKKGVVGSTQPKLPLYNIEKIPVPVLPIENQTIIANSLSSLDDKIELNLQMNQTLEAMAQAIFKEWFVNFNFPGFDGELVDGLPKGWRKGKLNEVARIEIGRTPPRMEEHWFSTDPKNIKWISIKDLGLSGVYIFNTSEYLTQEAVEKFRIPIIPENTVVLSFKLTIGRLAITTERCLSNEAIAQINSDILSTEFIYTYLKTYNWGSLGSTSSIATAINSKIIKEMEVLIPDVKILNQFQEVLKPIFEKLKVNLQEIETLTQIRDSLLPKLMTGKIEIKA